ncbi:porin [uncultured Shimia sp.]|uniref:porin n=1 Tax=uncultured Shimia sp. TaxID=573152 RepID=UPI00262F329D|nr:porin [uncultured Shimia sp.]
MKKILFASTALVATAGVAAAELTWSGSGRLGVVYTENASQDTVLDHRFRLTVNGVTETDGGVKFEGRIRWQADDGISGGNVNGGGATGGAGAAGFAVSTGGFRVDVGHVSDVFDSGDVVTWGGHGVGYTGFLDQAANFSGFQKVGFGNGQAASQTIKALYSISDFTVNASYTLNDTTIAGADENWQIGAGYNFGAHRIGAMYGDDKMAGKQWAIGADGSFGDFSYAALVGDNDTVNDTMFGLSGAYAVSAAGSITGFVSSGGGSGLDTSYGIGYSHSLGGGVSLAAGVGSNSAGNTQADAGVTFSF